MSNTGATAAPGPGVWWRVYLALWRYAFRSPQLWASQTLANSAD